MVLRRSISLLTLMSVAGAALFAGPVLAAPPAMPSLPAVQTSAPVFDKNTRLDKLIDVSEIAIPLNELLARYSDEHWNLKVARDCAGQKLQIRLKQRSLRVLMQAIADLLPGTWTPRPDGSGYYFEMSAKAIRQREDWWQLFLSERAKAEARQRAFLLSKLREPSQPIQPPRAGGEESDPESEARTAAEHDFFHALPADLQDKIANSRTSSPLFAAGIPMSGSDYNEGALMVPVSDLPAGTQAALQHKCAGILWKEPGEVNMNGAMLKLSNGGFGVAANVVFPDGRDMGSAFSTSMPISPDALPLIADPSRLERPVDQMGDKAPEEWKRLVAAARSRVWKNDLPAKVSPLFQGFGRVEELRWLGNINAMEYVADYYSDLSGSYTTEEALSAPLQRPLCDELNDLALARNTSWKQSGDVYLFRANRWRWLDHTEVDAPTLRHLFALHTVLHPEETRAGVNQKPLTPQQTRQRQYDWNADVVKNLNIWQITGGLKSFTPTDDAVLAQTVVVPDIKLTSFHGISKETALLQLRAQARHVFNTDVTDLLPRYETFRFYADLEDTQRAALLEDKLAYTSLSAAQREQATYLYPDLIALLHRQDPASLLLGLTPNAKMNYKGQMTNLVVASH